VVGGWFVSCCIVPVFVSAQLSHISALPSLPPYSPHPLSPIPNPPLPPPLNPHPSTQIGRRLDQGGYALIAALDELPPRAELEALFYADSVNRDKDLTFLDRLKKQVPNFGN
jgi:hypothetical protein